MPRRRGAAKTAEAEAAQRSADEYAKKAADAEAARAMLPPKKRSVKLLKRRLYKKQIEEQQQQQKLILISIAAFLALIGSAATVFVVRQRKRAINSMIGIEPTVRNHRSIAAEGKAAKDGTAAATASTSKEDAEGFGRCSIAGTASYRGEIASRRNRRS